MPPLIPTTPIVTDLEKHVAGQERPLVNATRWELTQALGRDAAQPFDKGKVIVAAFKRFEEAVGVCAETFRYLKPLFLGRDKQVNGFTLKNGTPVLFIDINDERSWKGLDILKAYIIQ